MASSAAHDEEIDDFARAMAKYAGVRRAGSAVAELINEQAARVTASYRLSDEAREQQEAFTRDGTELAELSVRHLERAERFTKHWTRDNPAKIFTPRDLLHVFGADVDETHGEFFYRKRWASIDGYGTGIGATADPVSGRFSASQYVIGNSQAESYGGIGVLFRPRSHLCTLSVRPIVQWTGMSTLTSRLYDPQLSVEAWAQSYGAIGVHVQSRTGPGAPIHEDAGRWVPMWDRLEKNPNASQLYDSMEGPGRIGLEGVFATDEREVLVWVSCHAFVMTQARFGLDTHASGYLSCQMPYLVVEETPLP